MAPNFSVEQDEILVEEVANHPSLWQLSHPRYKDHQKKDSVWVEVSDKIGKPVDECKRRWRNIKDTYDRKKIKKTGSTTSSTKKGKKWALEEKLSFLQTVGENRGGFSNITATEEEEYVEYPLQVEIFEPTLPVNASSRQTLEKSTPTLTASPVPPSPQASSQWTFTRTHPATSNISTGTTHREKCVTNLEKRAAERITNIQNLLSAEQTVDEIDLFFHSMAKSVKKLSRHLQQRAKVETLTIIGKLEDEMWNSFDPIRKHSYSTPASDSLSPIGSTHHCSDSPSNAYSPSGSTQHYPHPLPNPLSPRERE